MEPESLQKKPPHPNRFVPIPSAFEAGDLDPGEPVLPAMPAWDRGPSKVESALPEAASHPKGAVLVR